MILTLKVPWLTADAERPGAPEPWEARDYLFQQRQPETLLPRHPEMHAGGSGAKGTWEASLDASGMSVTYYYIPPHPGPDAAVPPLAPQATTTLDGYSGAPQGGGKRNTYGAELGKFPSVYPKKAMLSK